MFASGKRNAEQNHNLMISDKFFENVAKSGIGNNINISKFYHKEIKSRLNSGNACCHYVQSLPSKYLNINVYKI
jgi:hypothetical protein